MTPQGLQTDFACTPPCALRTYVFYLHKKTSACTPMFSRTLKFFLQKYHPRKAILDNFLMIGNIPRMIGIVEIYEKKLFRNTAGALKEVFKAILHEKP